MASKNPLSILILLICLIPFLAEGQSILDTKITENFQNQPISSILEKIGQTNQISIFYKASALPTQPINIAFDLKPLSIVLPELLKETELGFLAYRSYGILILPAKIIEEGYTAEYYQTLEAVSTKEELANKNTINIGAIDNLNPSGKAIIEGTVQAESTLEAIIGATVFITDLNQGVSTDEKGHFRLEVPLGEHELQIQYLGHEDLNQLIKVYNNGAIALTLSQGAVDLDEVIITAKTADFNVDNAQIGLTNIDVAAIKKLPTFLGETDIIKGLLLQPGVSTLGEGAIGFNVRGGAVDQNLVIQNEGIIFNSSHALGFFSTFNADLIKKITLYKGSMPAQYGGRLASVLDVEMRDGDFQGVKVKAGIGPVSGRVSLEGPIIKGKSSFIAGFRSTYSDWVLNLIKVPEIQQSTVFFYDANLNFTHRFNEKNTLIFSAYASHDNFGFNQDFGFDYGTKNAQLIYKKTFSEKLFSKLSVGTSRYESTQLELGGTNASELDINLNYYKLKELVTFLPTKKLSIHGGFSSIWYRVEPGAIRPRGTISQIIPKSLEFEQSLESAVFANADWAISPAWLVSAGLRLSHYQNIGPKTVFQYVDETAPTLESTIGNQRFEKGKSIATYTQLEPRFSLRYRLNASTSIKAGYSRTAQYLNQIFNTNTATPSSQWQLSNAYIKPLRAHNFSIGYFRNFDNNIWETSMETYFRSIDPLFDYIDFANLTVNEQIETQLVSGIGRSYGLEMSIKKTTGNIHGALSYTFSRSDQKVAGINEGQWYLSNLDKPHDISLLVNLQPNQRNTFTFNFNYASGRPTTVPIASYQENNGVVVPIYSTRNQFRIPDYHRLDFAYTRGKGYKKGKKFKTSWTFSIYNVYGRRNAFSVFYSQKPFKSPKANRLSILGNAFPAITFNFESI